MAVNAHDAIIYGIDWSRHSEYELSTCSLDKTVKFWDTRTTDRDEHGPGARLLNTIQTDYPVWRAKYPPFGRGVLTQPHRESAKLEMYRSDKVDEPVHTFEGFEGVVKEYVWRLKGGENDAYGMQAIISSTGRSLNIRFSRRSRVPTYHLVSGLRLTVLANRTVSPRGIYEHNSVNLPIY